MPLTQISGSALAVPRLQHPLHQLLNMVQSLSTTMPCFGAMHLWLQKNSWWPWFKP